MGHMLAKLFLETPDLELDELLLFATIYYLMYLRQYQRLLRDVIHRAPAYHKNRGGRFAGNTQASDRKVSRRLVIFDTATKIQATRNIEICYAINNK